jgi:hypothetical protein
MKEKWDCVRSKTVVVINQNRSNGKREPMDEMSNAHIIFAEILKEQ